MEETSQRSPTKIDAQAAAPWRIPEHALLHPIASGAYGEVWLARNLVETPRAVKIVRRDQHATAESFEREFKGLQKFEPVSRTHEGLVDILTLGLLPDGAGFYYVMELADDAGGRASSQAVEENKQGAEPPLTRPADTLSHRMGEGRGEGIVAQLSTQKPLGYVPRTLRAELKSRGALPADEVIALGLKLTAALAHLHANGLVHRDVKPSNILFIGGEPKLADAGLVAAMDDARSLVGTVGYIAPEGPGTPQADLYALGKVHYEAAFGKDRQEFPALPADVASRPDHARLLELNAILLKACATDRRERYPNAEALLADLKHLSVGKSVRRAHQLEQRWHLIRRGMVGLGLAAALLALVVVGAVFAFRELNRTPARSSNREAQNLYETALAQLQKIPQRQAPEAYTNLMEAIKRNPEFIDAYYQLFEIYADSWGGRLPPFFNQEANQRWVATKLWNLDRDSAQYHTVNAWLKFGRWQFGEAISEALRATQLDPKFVRAHVEYAHFMLLLRGDVETARKRNEIVVSLRGSDSASPGGVATLYYERHFPEVIELLKRAQKLNPHSPYDMLGPAYEALGEYENAINAYEECDKLSSDDPAKTEANYQKQRAALKEHGPRGWWREKLDQLRQNPPSDQNEYEMAKLYARLDEKEEALKLLEKGCVDLHSLAHNSAMVWLLVDYEWDSMRQDPRFVAIVKKMGLGPK